MIIKKSFKEQIKAAMRISCIATYNDYENFQFYIDHCHPLSLNNFNSFQVPQRSLKTNDIKSYIFVNYIYLLENKITPEKMKQKHDSLKIKVKHIKIRDMIQSKKRKYYLPRTRGYVSKVDIFENSKNLYSFAEAKTAKQFKKYETNEIIKLRLSIIKYKDSVVKGYYHNYTIEVDNNLPSLPYLTRKSHSYLLRAGIKKKLLK
jgi:hypothetical protein